MDAFGLLWIPFLLALVFTGMHSYLGLHVLARKIVFVDLALAQISALGATVAFMLGHAPQTAAAYAYSLAFTLTGAVLLSFSRRWTGASISQEAFVGVIYVVSAAAAVVLVDRAPLGAEHLKQILTGSILTASAGDLLKLSVLYALVGAVHWFFRRPLLRISFAGPGEMAKGARFWWWDFLFYALFGVVVTSSVAAAGVLLVFSFLIIPALIGRLYTNRLGGALAIAMAAGAVSSAAGLAGSYGADLPTGAALVCALGLSLALAAALKPLLPVRGISRRAMWRRLTINFSRAWLAAGLASALWLAAYPQADQPALDLLEYYIPGLRAPFLSPAEEALLRDSYAAERRATQEAARLNEMERNSRWQGEPLPDEELRRISSYTQSFFEMTKGERLVQRAILDKARERQRWVLGVPAIAFCLAGFLLLAGRTPAKREETQHGPPLPKSTDAITPPNHSADQPPAIDESNSGASPRAF